MKVLSVKQPWAWLLIHGGKDIENRDWCCLYRGPLAIHASKSVTAREWCDCVDYVRHFDHDLAERIPKITELQRGAIIGTVYMRGCVIDSKSPWFQGRYGFVPVPARGSLGLWNLDFKPSEACAVA